MEHIRFVRLMGKYFTELCWLVVIGWESICTKSGYIVECGDELLLESMWVTLRLKIAPLGQDYGTEIPLANLSFFRIDPLCHSVSVRSRKLR